MNSLQRGSFTTGLVIGLLAGLGVALAVALYITKAPVPFVNKAPQRSADQDAAEAERNKHWDPNAPLAGKNPAKPQPVAAQPAPLPAGNADAGQPAAGTSTAASPAPAGVPAVAPNSAPAAVAAQRPLPTQPAASAAANPRTGRDPAAILAGQADPAASQPKPVAKAASAVVAAFFVQAGAYTRQEDAEAQRARLALMDMNARITEREQAGRTVYRVRLGPFDGRSDAEDAQGRLSGAGIDANLVRVER